MRVHWWYSPDSYDEYVAASVAPEELDDEKPSKGAGDPPSYPCCARRAEDTSPAPNSADPWQLGIS